MSCLASRSLTILLHPFVRVTAFLSFYRAAGILLGLQFDLEMQHSPVSSLSGKFLIHPELAYWVDVLSSHIGVTFLRLLLQEGGECELL